MASSKTGTARTTGAEFWGVPCKNGCKSPSGSPKVVQVSLVPKGLTIICRACVRKLPKDSVERARYLALVDPKRDGGKTDDSKDHFIHGGKYTPSGAEAAKRKAAKATTIQRKGQRAAKGQATGRTTAKPKAKASRPKPKAA